MSSENREDLMFLGLPLSGSATDYRLKAFLKVSFDSPPTNCYQLL